MCVHEPVLSHFYRVQHSATLWTVACQALLSMGFSRQEYWGGLPCPPPGDLSDPGIELTSLMSLAYWQVGSLPLVPPGKPRSRSALQSFGRILIFLKDYFPVTSES